MRNRYRLFRRGRLFYSEDSVTGKQGSLRTRSSREAEQLLQSKNQAARSSLLNRELGRIFYSASDPAMVKRTWAAVMAEFASHGRPSTRLRYERAMRDSALDPIRNRPIVETTSADLLAVLLAAERAYTHGYPERFAQAALGHSSKAVHQAYAKGAKVVCTPLEEYEKKVIPLPWALAKRDNAEAVAR